MLWTSSSSFWATAGCFFWSLLPCFVSRCCSAIGVVSFVLVVNAYVFCFVVVFHLFFLNSATLQLPCVVLFLAFFVFILGGGLTVVLARAVDS